MFTGRQFHVFMVKGVICEIKSPRKISFKQINETKSPINYFFLGNGNKPRCFCHISEYIRKNDAKRESCIFNKLY